MMDVARMIRPALITIAVTGLVMGLGLRVMGHHDWASWAWVAATLPVLAALLAEIVTSLRRGDYGLDVVAALSMSAALAFGETLAAAVVALMFAGGSFSRASRAGRARREMTALLARAAPRRHRLATAGSRRCRSRRSAPGDLLLVRRGEVVPVDGLSRKAPRCSTSRR